MDSLNTYSHSINQSGNRLGIVEIQKMLFIYNALLSGWSVKMIAKDKFEFVKEGEQKKKEVNLTAPHMCASFQNNRNHYLY